MFNSANRFTFLRFLLTPVFIFLILGQTQEFKVYSYIVFFIATLTDWFDGYLARKYQETTKLGAFIDPLADKVLVSSALFIFVHLKYIELWMVMVIVVRDFLITGLRSYAIFSDKPVVTSSLAKWKTFIQLLIIQVMLTDLVFPEVFTWIQNGTLKYLINQAMLLTVVISVYTAAKYLLENKQHLKGVIAYFFKTNSIR